MTKTHKGSPYPLGSTYDGNGVNFALFSAHATKVELCLFDEYGIEEKARFEILENNQNIWHIYIPNIKVGQIYGYRVYGPYLPEQGHRFNHNKLLIDPYAKKLTGKVIWHKAIFGYDIDSPDKDLSFSELDSAPYVPKSVVVDENSFDWGQDKKPNTDFSKTIIYETHVKGYTKLHPKIADSHRGTFMGMASSSITNYLKWLGVTAVELLPVHAFFGNRHKEGVKDNYWGYETYNFFAPEQSYLADDNIDEFKKMVKSMHRNGIEVILDVVYNHTGEGNQLGPTISFRGIDNASYYVLSTKDKRYYYDSTGTGSSFNIGNHYVNRLVLDSLRYWANVMRVDGFRFDLATTLSRNGADYVKNSTFLASIQQDPSLQNIKLIAEPWDLGYAGYQLGSFPTGWSEWNDKYRDVFRRLWKGDEGQVAEAGYRITGSSDLFNHNNRNISSSINFITAHDGFTLYDLVSYNNKKNTANEENNKDGTDSNWSWNSGGEGEVDNEDTLQNRLYRVKAMMATLFMSFGTPMILAGDEFLRSQKGNNNAYCQDNIISWLAWEAIDKTERSFARYIKKLISLRKKLKIFNRNKFFDASELMWYDEFAQILSKEEWLNFHRKHFLAYTKDKNRYVCCIANANSFNIDWKLPSFEDDYNWKLHLDSSDSFSKPKVMKSGDIINVPAWSLLLLEARKKSNP